jgi:hypothetical protein
MEYAFDIDILDSGNEKETNFYKLMRLDQIMISSRGSNVENSLVIFCKL